MDKTQCYSNHFNKQTCTMPEPISPPPMTVTVLMASLVGADVERLLSETPDALAHRNSLLASIATKKQRQRKCAKRYTKTSYPSPPAPQCGSSQPRGHHSGALP